MHEFIISDIGRITVVWQVHSVYVMDKWIIIWVVSIHLAGEPVKHLS